MITLWDEYNNLLNKDASDWYYYTNQDACSENISKFRNNKPYSSNKAANDFLHSYFSAGDKNIFKIGSENLGYSHERNLHSASLYFLGLTIAEKLGYDLFIKNNENVLNEPIKKRFLFNWFMTCLYHDIGYYFEENYDNFSDLDSFSSFLNKYKIEDEYKTDAEELFCGEQGLKNKCEKYYKFRYKYHKFDHGITGGILLYNELVNNYYHARDKYNIEHHSNEDEFDYGQLYYSKNFFKDYKNAALAIIQHNMWVANENSVKKYINEQLYELIPASINSKGKFKKYSVEDGMLFLLCLADTIEPLKYFKDFEPKFVLKHIEINISRFTMEIKVKSPLIADGYFENIKKLAEWMNVDVNSDSTCEIEIIDNRKSIEDDWERMVLIGIHE